MLAVRYAARGEIRLHQYLLRRQPYLDITQPHPDQYGTYDFILSSDVFEHVAIPVERAFEEAFRLLKPHGVLCITVPSSRRMKILSSIIRICTSIRLWNWAASMCW